MTPGDIRANLPHPPGSYLFASLTELTKRYPRAPANVTPGLEALKQRPEAGSAIPGWHRMVRKLRINSTDIRRGKRLGFRLIYYLEGRTIYPLLTYAKANRSAVSNQEIMPFICKISRHLVALHNLKGLGRHGTDILRAHSLEAWPPRSGCCWLR